MKGYLFKFEKFVISNCSIQELLVRKTHVGGLVGHFGEMKTLDVVKEHFYWPNMIKDMH